jgi:hypothetical protein
VNKIVRSMLGLSLAATLAANAPHAAALQPPVESAPAASADTPRDSERPPPGRMRVLHVPQTAVRPTVDGALDDAAWNGAAVAGRFWISEQERWPSEQTEVLITADREYLYVGFRVTTTSRRRSRALQTPQQQSGTR